MTETRYIGDSESGAVFSECRMYRYSLWRRWKPGEHLIAFIGLNPSTADETANDPTVAKLIEMAKRWGYDGMVMLNAFAFRATDPKNMKIAHNPVGELNNQAILHVCERVSRVVYCWGNHAVFRDRNYEVKVMLRHLVKHHFGLNKTGEPKHPLYLKNASELFLFLG